MTQDVPGPNRIGVVVVTFHPPSGMEARLRAMRDQGALLVVVDNASSAVERAALEADCTQLGGELIANSENAGLAAALNQGIARLREAGCEWALLFDQDSLPPARMAERLLSDAGFAERESGVAVIGPNFRDPSTGQAHRFLRRHPCCRWMFQKCRVEEAPTPVTMVITSGSLLNLNAYAAVGPFDQSLFIDFVDTDFCLRCRAAGWTILASSSVCMDHRLGARDGRRWVGLEIRATNHSPLRHYYIARNRVPMIRRHAWREKHWFMFECAAALLWMGRVLSVERCKGKKLAAIFLGTRDGLLGRSGKCPESRRRWLEE